MPLAREFPVTKLLPRIACPVLVVQGALDPFGYAGQAAALDAGIGNLERVVLPDAGHLPHREDQPAVIHAVTRFLRRIESKRT
jgi:pimeloyl-ACP methyl ester carboxylesterase